MDDKCLYLAGPTGVGEEGRGVLAENPRWHRDPEVVEALSRIRTALQVMTNVGTAIVASGGGTFSNDSIAMHLRALGQKGVIVTNGEFGERLCSHAKSSGLEFYHHESGWGNELDLQGVYKISKNDRSISWMWAALGESSTSMLNDLPALKKVSADLGLRLCLDCVSVLGAVDIDLSNIWMASGASGKYLHGVHGIAFLMIDSDEPGNLSDVPVSMAVKSYVGEGQPPFSINGNLILAIDQHMASTPNCITGQVRDNAIIPILDVLRENRIQVVSGDSMRIPGAVTAKLPTQISSSAVGEVLEKHGFITNYRSRYLLLRNWLQMAIPGDRDVGRACRLSEVLGNTLKSAQGEQR